MTLSTQLRSWRIGLRPRRRRVTAHAYLRQVARDQVNPRYRRFYESLADVTESAQTDAARAFDRATDVIEQLARGLSQSLQQSGLAVSAGTRRRGPGRPRLYASFSVGRRRGRYRLSANGRRRRRGRVGRPPIGRRRRRATVGRPRYSRTTRRRVGRPPLNGRRRRTRLGRPPVVRTTTTAYQPPAGGTVLGPT